MKKPVTTVLDWLWDCFTKLVMNQGRDGTGLRRPPP